MNCFASVYGKENRTASSDCWVKVSFELWMMSEIQRSGRFVRSGDASLRRGTIVSAHCVWRAFSHLSKV